MPAALTANEKAHPAKYSSSILTTLDDLMLAWLGAQPAPEPLIMPGWTIPHRTTVETLWGAQAPPGGPWRVLDPFAGVGWIHRIARLDRVTFAGELEHEFIRPYPCSQVGKVSSARSFVADAAALPFLPGTFHAVATSPVYPNRMRDHHNARDASERMSYTHKLRELTRDWRRELRPESTGASSNRAYAAASATHIREMIRVVVPEGFLFLNLSNSVQDRVENNAVELWLNWLTLRSCHIREVATARTSRYRNGANYSARADHEVVIVAQTPPTAAQPSLI